MAAWSPVIEAGRLVFPIPLGFVAKPSPDAKPLMPNLI